MLPCQWDVTCQPISNSTFLPWHTLSPSLNDVSPQHLPLTAHVLCLVISCLLSPSVACALWGGSCSLWGHCRVCWCTYQMRGGQHLDDGTRFAGWFHACPEPLVIFTWKQMFVSRKFSSSISLMCSLPFSSVLFLQLWLWMWTSWTGILIFLCFLSYYPSLCSLFSTFWERNPLLSFGFIIIIQIYLVVL